MGERCSCTCHIVTCGRSWVGNFWSTPLLNSNGSCSSLPPPQEHEQLSYSSTRTKAPSVIISGLKPATWYVFSVRTRTPAGYSSYSPKHEYESTGDCEYQRHLQLFVSLCLYFCWWLVFRGKHDINIHVYWFALVCFLIVLDSKSQVEDAIAASSSSGSDEV